MPSVRELIHKASFACGSDAALARELGVGRAMVSLLRSGQRALSPELAARLADIAGEDAREAVIDAVIAGAKGTKNEKALREILGKALAAGVAGMSVFSYSGSSIMSIRRALEALRQANRERVATRRRRRDAVRMGGAGQIPL